MISMNKVSKHYGSFQVLTDCTTQVHKGEVIVVCGPSGSGKSTLIKCVNGLEPFQSGEIIVNGVSVGDPKTNLSKLRSTVGMVFQNFELFPHMSIIDNLAIAQVKVLGRTQEQAREKGFKLLDRVGLRAQAENIRASFPVVSSSVWQSPGLWPWTRSACCLTNPRRRSTRRWSTKCST
jgi:glutamate/aspartate transport system ATP-binding protein